jgi:ABC-type phosphate transport system substrate-binding protein
MKRLMIALAVGAFVLSMAAMASATDINIYGASAQFNFWSAQAGTYLGAGGAGCTGAVSSRNYTPSDTPTTTPPVFYHGAKYFIATATNCSINSGGTVTIRVGAYDSADGIYSVIGTTNVLDVNGCTGNQRAMLAGAGANTLTCEPINLGAADVNGLSINEISISQLDGPRGPVSGSNSVVTGSDGNTYDLGNIQLPNSAYQPNGYAPIDTTGGSGSIVIDHHPLVLPFGIFVNKTLQTNTNAAYPTGLQNVTTAMVEEIFSGSVTNWDQFGLPSQAVTLCFRTAGSGSFGLFDNSLMNTNLLGPGIPATDTTTANGTAGGQPSIWFNNTSGDMMNCIASQAGAIGFADADQGNTAASSAGCTVAEVAAPCQGSVGPLTLNGNLPSSANVNNGTYERFFSLEHIFELKTLSTTDPAAHTVINSMVTYANNPANIPLSRQPYWTTATNPLLLWHKSSDQAFPAATGNYGSD